MSSSTSVPTSLWLLLYLNIALYSFFFWFNKPLFPYLSRSFGASDTEIGYLGAINQTLQFVGTFFLGWLVDRRGAKFCLLLSHIAAAAHYAALFGSSSVAALFWSSVPTTFMAAMQISQTITALMSGQENASKSDSSAVRSVAIGRLSLMYGVGFVAGPFLGGLFSSRFSLQAAALVAAGGEVLLAIVLAFAMPNLSKPSESKPQSPATASSSASFLSTLRTLLSDRQFSSLLLLKFLVSLCVATFHSFFSLLLLSYFQVNPSWNGIIMSGVGLLSILVNGLGMKTFIQWGHSKATIKGFQAGGEYFLLSTCISHLTTVFGLLCIICLALPNTALVNAKEVYFYLILLIIVLVTFYSSISGTLSTSLVSKSVPDSSIGVAMSCDMSIGSFSRIIAPILAPMIVQNANHNTGVTAAQSLASHLSMGIFLSLCSATALYVTRRTVGAAVKNPINTNESIQSDSSSHNQDKKSK